MKQLPEHQLRDALVIWRVFALVGWVLFIVAVVIDVRRAM